MSEVTTELRVKVMEIAERTVHTPYMMGYSTQPNGGAYDSYRDKDIEEVVRRADRILNWVVGMEDNTPRTLIDKLRGVLCEGK